MVAWDQKKINYAQVKLDIAKETGHTPSAEDIEFFSGLRNTNFIEVIKNRNEHYERLSAIIHFYSPYLTEIQRTIIHFRLGNADHPSLKLNEIGERIGITGSRVRQIEKIALFNIERMMTGKQVAIK
jgi:DNA-directed RNA polymerase sigma subunit (sigma70/sigma32)